MTQWKKPVYWLRYLFVVALYGAFFLVHWFYNIDIPQVRPVSQGKSVVTRSAQLRIRVISQSDPANPGHTKVRLNKRFHPSAAPVIPDSIVVVECPYPDKIKLGSYTAPDYADPCIIVHSLRGPPSAA